MIALLHRFALDLFGRLPRPARRLVVRTIAPSYTVGAVCLVERDDGAVVLLQQRYRSRWGLPGGLLARGEPAHEAVLREVREEIGLVIELDGAPTVVVDERVRRVDVVFRGRPTNGDSPQPTSPEIVAVDWFGTDDLPDLQEETVAALEALGKLGPARG